jgi:hypothetical protein
VTTTGLKRVVWIAALAAAVLWPSKALSMFDGIPLDGRAEAVLVGIGVPLLLWLRARYLDSPFARVLIVALLAFRIADAALLTQQGLCARFSTAAPYATNVLTIPIEEPAGALRSWDVRADWRAANPVCTAVVDRRYVDGASFPAWFTNITDFATDGKRELSMDLRGYARAGERGLFVLESGRDMTISGRIDSQDVSSTGGAPILAALDAGVHHLDLHASLTGADWRLVPTFNGADAFRAMTLTTAAPRAVDRLAGVFSAIEAALLLGLFGVWAGVIVLSYRTSPALLAWCVLSAALFAVLGATGRFERLAVLLLAAAVLVPVADEHRNLRGALLLVGVPWLALIAARSLPQVAHVTAYSNDDWLAYQVAGYRIFMSGFWLEAGSRVFDYQPLYRWITGVLHLLFGDSSVGEVYWDAICLLLGSVVAFVLVDRTAGFRWGIAAAAATLATFWIGTIWYFVGRGLSEIAAAGWGFIAALLLSRDKGVDAKIAIAAGVFAVLMFYTRLNHLLFAVFLLALLTPFALGPAVAYLATFAAGVALFATRTWWYTGVFSILYGTSLKNNDTGLRLGTIASPEVWGKIWHSLKALAWMNEPPSPDPRALLVVLGVLLSIGTLLQLPKLNRVPVGLAVVTLGACASSFLAHTHNYPGRMSIHLAPFAVAMTAAASARLAGR